MGELAKAFEEWQRKKVKSKYLADNPYGLVSQEGDTLRFKTPNDRILYQQRLAKLNDQKQPKLSDEEEAGVRIATQSFFGLPLQGEYPGSVIAGRDSVKFGLKDKKKSPKQLNEDRYYSLLTRSARGRLNPKDQDELNRMISMRKASAKETPADEDVYSKKMMEAENVLNKNRIEKEIVTEDGQQYEISKTVPFYSEDVRNAAEGKKQAYADSLFWLNESKKLQQKGVPIRSHDLQQKYQQGKQVANDLMLQFKAGKLPTLTSDGLRELINKNLAPLGMDLEDINYFDRRGK
jgi:hypothetical protein